MLSLQKMRTPSIKFFSPSKKNLVDICARARDWPKKPFKFPYGFLCGQIFVKEEHILDEADFERMVDAPGPSDAFRVLTDTGLADDMNHKDYVDYEQVISADRQDLKNFYEDYLQNSQLIQFLFLRYDIANMKVLAKALFTDISLDDDLLYQCGLFEPEKIVRFLKSSPQKVDEQNNGYLLKLAQKLKEEEDLSPHRIDVISDQYHYKFLRRIVFRIGSGFLKKYLQFKIDTLNFFNTVRALKMEMEKEDFFSQLLTGGKIKKLELKKIIKENSSLDDLEEKLVEEWNKNWPLEKLDQIKDPQLWEDIFYQKQLHFIEESERQNCGVGLVLGYFLRKQKTYRRIRQIMKAKIDGVDPAEIKKIVV